MTAPKFNAMEVAKWLSQKCEEHNLPSARITIESSDLILPVYGSIEVAGERRVSIGHDVDGVLAALASQSTATSLARLKREKARKLLEEAAQLEAEGAS